MKKLALFALTLSSLSFATSIRSTALELKDVPLRHMGASATIIRVAADGEVFGGTCGVTPSTSPIAPEIDYAHCDWTTVKFLTRYEIRKLSQLTKAAQHGQVVYPNPGGIMCLALPTRHATYTANNGTTMLQQGSYPCGYTTFNSSPAAKQLVQWLRDLRAEYRTLVD